MSFFGWNSKSKKEFESLSKQLEKRFNGYLQGHSAQLLGQVKKDNSAPLGYLNALKNRREYDVIGTFNINAYLVDRLFEFLRHETAKSAGVAVEGVKKEQIEQAIQQGTFQSLTQETVELFFLRCLSNLSSLGVEQAKSSSIKLSDVDYGKMVSLVYKIEQKFTIARANVLAQGIIADKDGLKAVLNPDNPYKKLSYDR